MPTNTTNSVRATDTQTGLAPDDELDGFDTHASRSLPVALNSIAMGTEPHLSVIVPTRNEARNVAPLLERLGPAVEPLRAEIIFVDDSDDDTAEALAASAITCPVPVRLLRRSRHGRRGGLGSAVIAGARHARGAWVLVMDGDLQHPPESAALLARAAMGHDADIVVATRYAGSGSAAGGLDGTRRALISSWATRLVKSAFPRRLAMVSDPLSGMFAFRAAAIDLDRLNPVGFKILLEILVRYPLAKVAEVAYPFERRQADESKASLRVGFTFLRHLVRLRRARLVRQLLDGPPTRQERIWQVGRMLAFGLIGATGVVVNTATLWFFYKSLGWNHLVGAAVATQASTAWNFVLVDTLVYRKRSHGTRRGRAIRFCTMNNLLLLARLPVLEVLVRFGVGVLTANAITLVMLFLVRFAVSDRAIFGTVTQERGRGPVRVLVDVWAAGGADGSLAGTGESAGRKRSRYLTYRYDIAGVVTIGSQIMLPELEFFRAQWVADDDVDIAVRVGDVGARMPRRRAAMTEYSDPAVVRYEEHLGRLGANFRAHLGDPITVEVGPLLARSPHVVYTNIIEALLRFVMVSRGRMLLHSACVELDGTGVMLSALTDTGKTGTVLRLLREHGGKFLSDDMTIIDAHGTAWCFPKPLTISSHTLRAVSADDLTRAEWRRLQFQSRLHSKGGRSLAVSLSQFNVPIMGINAVTQILVPPPKYAVDRLIPCRVTNSARITELFIIERGSPRLADLDREAAIEQLLTNTDDAYSFPPFRYLAPAITIGGEGYQQLRIREREILSSFLGQVRIRTLASDTFGWADEIPHLIRESSEPAGQPMVAVASGAATGSDGWPPPGGGLADGRAGTRLADAPDGRAGTTLADAPDGRAGTGLADGLDVPTLPSAADAGEIPDLPASPLDSVPRPRKPADVPADRARLWQLPAWLPVTAILATAAFLRLWQLAAVGFNSDEAVYTGSAASLAGDGSLRTMFPVFRAHPLLFQVLLSLVLRVHDTDWTARALAAAIGVATVAVTLLLGSRLYGRKAGLAGALLLAVMPYHVIVSRQVLLDGLMTLFATATLYCVVRYADGRDRRWLLAAGAMMGASILTKETSVVLLGSLYAFFMLTHAVRTELRHVLMALAVMVAEILAWPLALRASGQASTGQNYLLWQLFRRPNHGTWFYFSVLPSWIGPAVLIAALLGILGLARRSTWRERLLLSWVIVPVIFFTIWPVKGFEYLLPIAPPLAVLAGRTLSLPSIFHAVGRKSLAGSGQPESEPSWLARAAMGALAVITVASLAVPSWDRIEPSATATYLAGTGGVSGGRETGEWVQRYVPRGARLLAIGPSMANILEFYGHHQVSALSVSPNSRDRNPAYVPVPNPDLSLRQGDFQYVVWDSYSAARSPLFAREARRLIGKFHGVAVFTATTTVRGRLGDDVIEPVIVLYEVHPT